MLLQAIPGIPVAVHIIQPCSVDGFCLLASCCAYVIGPAHLSLAMVEVLIVAFISFHFRALKGLCLCCNANKLGKNLTIGSREARCLCKWQS